MNNVNSNQYQEDEIDLKELFNTIMNKKIFIITITSVITILAIIWAITRTPIYEVKSNMQIGFIGDDLIANPNTLVKVTKLVFNVEDKITLKKDEKFISEVSDISLNKKLKNFIQIKTQAISNEEALNKNKEVVNYIEYKFKNKINRYIIDTNNKINNIKILINNIDNLETTNLKRNIEKIKYQKIYKIDEKIKQLNEQNIKNIERKINLLKTQDIVKIDEKIKFNKEINLISISKKIEFHIKKLNEYNNAVNKIYNNNKKTKDTTALTISSMQIVNYQNLILNSQNKIEDLKLNINIIENETIPNLIRTKNNIKNVTIKDLKLNIKNIKNITIADLKKQKENIQKDTLRTLEYKLKNDLTNKKNKLYEQIDQLKFNISKENIQNSIVIGDYVIHNSPIKPKKKLIVVVAFITGFILSIFLVFFLEFIRKEEEK